MAVPVACQALQKTWYVVWICRRRTCCNGKAARDAHAETCGSQWPYLGRPGEREEELLPCTEAAAVHDHVRAGHAHCQACTGQAVTSAQRISTFIKVQTVLFAGHDSRRALQLVIPMHAMQLALKDSPPKVQLAWTAVMMHETQASPRQLCQDCMALLA